jgi:N-acetylglutamate synthase-like GNAT family acetyltransferase
MIQTAVERARPADLEEVLQLLARHHLPPEGLRDHLATTLVARRSGRIVGSAALELYPDGALLRSVAVAPELQGRASVEFTSACPSTAIVMRRMLIAPHDR